MKRRLPMNESTTSRRTRSATRVALGLSGADKKSAGADEIACN